MSSENVKKENFLSKGIFITATDTDAGKTVVTGGIAKSFLQQGYNIDIIKPFATGGIPSPDAFYLSEAVGGKIVPEKIAPFSYEDPLAPYAILRRKNIDIDINKMFREIKKREQECEFLFVEGIGGILVPCLKHYSVIDFIVELKYPVLVVVRAGLGTINHSLMTLSLLKNRGVNILGFVTNHCQPYVDDESLCDNSQIISELSGCEWLGNVPYMENTDHSLHKQETVFEQISGKIQKKLI